MTKAYVNVPVKKANWIILQNFNDKRSSCYRLKKKKKVFSAMASIEPMKE
jgi:hypothetical protein